MYLGRPREIIISLQGCRGQTIDRASKCAKVLLTVQVPKEYYTKLTTPLPGWDGEIRDLVLKNKLVR